jgi:2-methylisocitrate lyase-like PEP mutase family enzyme
MTPADRLRALLAQPGLHVMPGCFDALSSKLIADAGYPLSFMSGFSVSAARLGEPDTGLISFGEMLDSLRAVTGAAPGVAILADGDTGYGNALNVQRTVREYAKAGAACVMIEDQVAPKKCGHTRGKQVVGRAEARMRVRAAVEARREHDILIMARTDARAVTGFDDALARCHDFVDEGADIIFLEAPESQDEMRRFCAEIPRPTMANMIDGGKTPILPPDELEAIGYRIAAYPLVLLSAAIAAMNQALAALRRGSEAGRPPELTFPQLQTAVGFPAYWEAEQRYTVD